MTEGKKTQGCIQIKITLENKEETPTQQFIQKIAQKQQYCEDQISGGNIELEAPKTQQYISEANDSISELESGCSATNSGKESPRSGNLNHEQNSPILSHARQLKEKSIQAKNQKKASRLQINLQNSNILLKRGQISDRIASDRIKNTRQDLLGSARLDLLGSGRLNSTRVDNNSLLSARLGSGRITIKNLQVKKEEEKSKD